MSQKKKAKKKYNPIAKLQQGMTDIWIRAGSIQEAAECEGPGKYSSHKVTQILEKNNCWSILVFFFFRDVAWASFVLRISSPASREEAIAEVFDFIGTTIEENDGLDECIGTGYIMMASKDYDFDKKEDRFFQTFVDAGTFDEDKIKEVRANAEASLTNRAPQQAMVTCKACNHRFTTITNSLDVACENCGVLSSNIVYKGSVEFVIGER